MLFKKWNDVFKQVLLASHPVSHSIFVMVANDTTIKISFQCVKNLHIALVLHNGEFRQYLKSG